MKKIKGKGIILVIAILLIGVLIIGGTYAYLTSSMSVNNGNYEGQTTCFTIDYSDNTGQLRGTLFPSMNAKNGLKGFATVKFSSTCTVNGRGTIYLNVGNGTSDKLISKVAGHCEKKNTLETQKNYMTQASCTAISDNQWVTEGTALKYAVLIGDSLYSSGYITSTDKGTEKAIYENFSVAAATKKIDVYVWLDGNLSNEEYESQPFAGNIKMTVLQVGSTGNTFNGDTPIATGFTWNS